MEVEVKARISDPFAVREKLESMGSVFGDTVEHKDSYFKPKGFDSRPEGPGDFILRIRSKKSHGAKNPASHWLTYKALTEMLGVWVEHETPIGNPEEAMNILEGSNFVHICTLNKKRTMGSCGDFEVHIDDVEELGKFIEVAHDIDDDGEKEATQARILEFLRKLGIDDKDIERRGYGELMGEKLGHKYHKMR
ncbi:MAG: class IV adenylate cyclase [Candidatus Aenigmatarchaeota archaeon]|nr:MAG: class IV adenylate cyclase [Candidatus Aenigmarchaeota archaeon]